MLESDALPQVRDIMIDFARFTGLFPARKQPTRYLWTDAFALCNFLELHGRTEDQLYGKLARDLVDQVHAVLGRHRPDDRKKGWLSGLAEAKGRLHPTAGGLRIGKKLRERAPDEPFDDEAEWDRDGQYFHYLTKWMHALNRCAAVLKDAKFNAWAIELAKGIHNSFVYTSRGSPHEKRMYWKMSTDLTYPLVSSMGHHDPLDGYVTYRCLDATRLRHTGGGGVLNLAGELRDMAEMCRKRSWLTDDPLGIGGLLTDSYRLAQLIVSGVSNDQHLLLSVLSDALTGIQSSHKRGLLKAPLEYRLAFRELGLSIGLKALFKLDDLTREKKRLFDGQKVIYRNIKALIDYMPLVDEIETFWLNAANQESAIWTEHRDINMAMLATSLAPGAYLTV